MWWFKCKLRAGKVQRDTCDVSRPRTSKDDGGSRHTTRRFRHPIGIAQLGKYDISSGHTLDANFRATFFFILPRSKSPVMKVAVQSDERRPESSSGGDGTGGDIARSAHLTLLLNRDGLGQL